MKDSRPILLLLAVAALMFGFHVHTAALYQEGLGTSRCDSATTKSFSACPLDDHDAKCTIKGCSPPWAVSGNCSTKSSMKDQMCPWTCQAAREVGSSKWGKDACTSDTQCAQCIPCYFSSDIEKCDGRTPASSGSSSDPDEPSADDTGSDEPSAHTGNHHRHHHHHHHHHHPARALEVPLEVKGKAYNLDLTLAPA